MAGDAARGVVVLPADVSDAELQRLHALGVRGVRFMMLAGAGGVLPWSALPIARCSLISTCLAVACALRSSVPTGAISRRRLRMAR